MKQTAVKWIEKEIERLTTRAGIHLSWELMESILNEAKAMEKEQIIESYCQGALDITNDELIFPRETSEEYYNELYKSQNNK